LQTNNKQQRHIPIHLPREKRSRYLQNDAVLPVSRSDMVSVRGLMHTHFILCSVSITSSLCMK